MRFVLTGALLVTIGCGKKREPAPAEMEDIASYMFQSWDDEVALTEAMNNLAPWLDEQAGTDEGRVGFQLTPLQPEEIDGVDHPDEDPTKLLAAAVAGLSEFPITDHLKTLVLPDQVFSNPNNYASYHRSVEGDESAFVNGSGTIYTTNDLETQNFGVRIPYILYKDYKWVPEADAVIGRAYLKDSACAAGGDNCLIQSYSIDLFRSSGGKTQRFTSTWNQVESPLNGIISEQVQIVALAQGLYRVYTSVEDFLQHDGLNQ